LRSNSFEKSLKKVISNVSNPFSKVSFKSHVKLLLQNAHSRIGTPYSVRMISIGNFAMSHLPITLQCALKVLTFITATKVSYLKIH